MVYQIEANHNITCKAFRCKRNMAAIRKLDIWFNYIFVAHKLSDVLFTDLTTYIGPPDIFIYFLKYIQVDLKDPDWVTNSAGLRHSHKHGFGLMSAWNIVNAAKVCFDNLSTKTDLHVIGNEIFVHNHERRRQPTLISEIV